jgi:hypothetical protein
VGEVVHDNGVIYSTGISHYNYNSLEYDNDNDITLDKLGNNGKYKHDLLRSAHVQSKSTKNLKPILGQKLAKTVSHRLRRASLNIAVKLHAIPNRKKTRKFSSIYKCNNKFHFISYQWTSLKLRYNGCTRPSHGFKDTGIKLC